MPASISATAHLGNTGLEVTRLGLGGWVFGGPWEFGLGAQDDADSIKAMRAAVARGVNWIDTAPVYGFGRSEAVIGRALRGLPAGDRPHVFTKCGLVWGEERGPASKVGRPDSIRRECDASLRRLGLDVVDLLQLHWPPEDGTPLADAWGALIDLRDEGKIRLAGVSNVSSEQLDACERVGHVDTLQAPLSLLRRSALESILQAAKQHTGVIVYSPMQSGLLSGRWSRKRSEDLADDDSRRESKLFTGAGLEYALALVDRLEPIADRHDVTVAELAIAWTLDQPGVTAAVVGARHSRQIEGWLGAGELVLDEETRGELLRALAARA